MSYTPMSDLGQQGLFDITRTLLQQPDLASLCEALSQLVKRSALADNAAIVLWQAQTQRASYYASREKDTPIKYEDETVLAHGPVRSILSRPDTLHCSYEEFCETWPQLDAGGLYPKFGHYCLMPLAAEGHIFGGCEFIRYDDRPWSEKEFNRLQTFTQIVSVVTEQIQSRVVNNVDYELLCRERDNFRILVAITNAVLSRLDMDELVSEVAKEIHYYFDIDDISIVLRSHRKNKLNIYSTHYLDKQHPAHEQSEVDEAGTLTERVFKSKESFGYATLDISSGRFRLSEPADRETMAAELQRTNPAELLYAEDFAEMSLIEGRRGLRRRPLWEFEIDTARQQLNLQFGTRDLVGFGVENAPRGLCAAGCLLQYAKDTQRTTLPHIRSITMEREQDSIIMDAATRRNLEITQNLAGGAENTLASVLDCTVTPMGSRMLKRWLHMPVRDTRVLLERQQTIGALQDFTAGLQPVLRQVGDLERILARLALRTARPRDLARMRHAFQQLPELRAQLETVDSAPVQALREKMGEFAELRDLLERAIIDTPPVLVRDGGVIASGYNEELDEWRALADGATDYLERLEVRERERTGLDTLKVGFNAVHGYYIQISRGQSHLAPINYMRRQTLKNAERYIIPELKEYEDKVLTSKGKALALEKQLYEELFDLLLPHLEALQQSASALAELDVLVNLAERAYTLNYTCPTFIDKPGIRITEGRHPVVEQVLNEPFIANPLNLSPQRRMLIITGPNMGGKSTYMRQTALIALMAYIGSYVPAQKVEIGPIDRIFTRVGAADDLASGRSTFMVEMTETANILHNATEYSLVLMDEIGRGTSTYDGLSLAWACAENLANKIKALTLFATHYFELTQLPEKMEGVANVHLDALEHGDTIAFMHSVQDGAASKSYGLAVAALAGVPKEVIKRARQKLRELESISPNAAATQVDGTQMSLLSVPEETSPAVEALENLDPDSLTPRQALEWIYRLKSLV